MSETLFKRIDHVAVAVRDLEKSLDFYEHALGFRQYFEHTVPVKSVVKIVYLKLGDTVLELLHMPEAPPPASFHFCIEVTDFDAAVRRLQELKIPMERPPHSTPPREEREQDWRRVVFLGPDGESIELRG